MADPTFTGFACSRNQPTAPFIKIEPLGCNFIVKFPYNRDAVDKLKSRIPYTDRSWSSERKAWIVGPNSVETICAILEETFGGRILRPEILTSQIIDEIRTIRLDYLGACKQRGTDPEASAFGSVNGLWSVEFPQTVLETFFGGKLPEVPSQHKTLYQVLLADELADDQAIKSAYRRLARQWHPDVCREDNAAEMFRTINEAAKILIDPIQRKKYDAGLFFEREGQRGQAGHSRKRYDSLFRAPLRCGILTVIGHEKVGRFRVTQIEAWADLINEEGQVAVSTWPAGADNFSIIWV